MKRKPKYYLKSFWEANRIHRVYNEYYSETVWGISRAIWNKIRLQNEKPYLVYPERYHTLSDYYIIPEWALTQRLFIEQKEEKDES